MVATLIAHGHAHHDIWDVYTLDEVRVYYAESRLREIDNLRNQALAARVSQTDKKGWKDFTKSLDQSCMQMRLEVEDEVIEGAGTVSAVRGKKNMDNFFGQLMNLPKMQKRIVPQESRDG